MSRYSLALPPAGHADGRRTVNRSRDAALVVLVATAYFVGTKIGFALTPGNEPIAMFWPPNAILLGALLLAPVRLWAPFLVALVPAHFLAQSQSGVPVVTSLGWLIGNSSEALLGALLICGWRRQPAVFRSVRGVTRFLVFGVILAPLLTSFLDAAIVVGTQWGRGYWVLWITRLLSNMLAQLTITPTIVEAGRIAMSIGRPPRRFRWEAIALAAAVVLSSLLVFRTDAAMRPDIPALIYLPLPLLLWAAMRFGPAGLSASLLTTAVVSIQSVMHGHGPFISTSVADSVMSMQVFLCTIGAPLLVLAVVATERLRATQSLRETSRKLIGAQEDERQRIARDLHDGIGQTLALAELGLDRVIADERHRPATSAALRTLRGQMTTVSQALWEVSHGLYPWNLEYIGLAHALHRLCADLQRETQLEIHCETTGIPDCLPADVALCLYRVAQEALQNIVRHSEATSASVSVRAHRRRLILQIGDDGIGFNQTTVTAGLGLASVRERLAAVDGGIEIDSTPGGGTRLDAWVALAPEPYQAAVAQ